MCRNYLPLQAGTLTPLCQRRALDGRQTVPQLNGVPVRAVLHLGWAPAAHRPDPWRSP